jgi:signal transduction histidine kinase
MKSKLAALSQRYVTALKKHLRQGPWAGLRLAQALGRQAVSIGLETLDLTKIHEGALAALEASSSRDGLIERAELFFKEAITPIEQVHRAALKTNVRLSQLNKALSQRTTDLAMSNRCLKQGAARRKTVEQALKKSRGNFQNLLKESRRLQEHLRHLAHQVLAAQENNRRKISHDLQDEIAQTLLGINVRLLTVKKAAGLNDQALQKEIASTQRLVDKSVTDIKQFARDFGKRHEA